MAFQGWPAEALEFYEGLEADNSKSYWQAHKPTYDECVLAPMQALLADLEPEFGAGKIFRPNRDVRFSKDKSPYKTHIGATLAGGGYVQLSANGLAAGSGRWHPDPDELERYRDAVVDDLSGERLAAIVADLHAGGRDLASHDSLKTAPRGYPKDHPRGDLLRRKGIAAWQQWPVAAWLGTAKAKDRVVEFYRGAAPLNDWLAKHVS